eukprot:scaffold1619_cov242-Prasinococcus_capsulatus_cf.AAC.2
MGGLGGREPATVPSCAHGARLPHPPRGGRVVASGCRRLTHVRTSRRGGAVGRSQHLVRAKRSGALAEGIGQAEGRQACCRLVGAGVLPVLACISILPPQIRARPAADGALGSMLLRHRLG